MTMFVTLSSAATGNATADLVKEMIQSVFGCHEVDVQVVSFPTEAGENLNIALDAQDAKITKTTLKRDRLSASEKKDLYTKLVQLFEEYGAANMFGLQKKLPQYTKDAIFKTLKALIAEGYLRQAGQKRGTTYFKVDEEAIPVSSEVAHQSR